MKPITISLLILSFATSAKLTHSAVSGNKPVEIRSGDWPILLERSIEQTDTTYSLQFRDEEVLTGQVMDTLSFPNLSQLKYFEKALTTLKTGHNGDVARFSNYSVGRADKKRDDIWYVLKFKWSATNFKQSEADMIVSTIRGLKFE